MGCGSSVANSHASSKIREIEVPTPKVIQVSNSENVNEEVRSTGKQIVNKASALEVENLEDNHRKDFD